MRKSKRDKTASNSVINANIFRRRSYVPNYPSTMIFFKAKPVMWIQTIVSRSGSTKFDENGYGSIPDPGQYNHQIDFKASLKSQQNF